MDNEKQKEMPPVGIGSIVVPPTEPVVIIGPPANIGQPTVKL